MIDMHKSGKYNKVSTPMMPIRLERKLWIAMLIITLAILSLGCKGRDAKILWDKACIERCLTANMSMEDMHMYRSTAEYDDIECVCISYITIDKR